MSPRQHILLNAGLCVLGVVGGSILGAGLSTAWNMSLFENSMPLTLFGIAALFALFGAIPALLFGIPAIRLLKGRGYSRWPATAVLTVGGGVVGGFLMFVTFGGFQTFGQFERLGATAGSSIGFLLGLLLFSGHSTVEA